jgi:hypothetical protein
MYNAISNLWRTLQRFDLVKRDWCSRCGTTFSIQVELTRNARAVTGLSQRQIWSQDWTAGFDNNTEMSLCVKFFIQASTGTIRTGSAYNDACK